MDEGRSTRGSLATVALLMLAILGAIYVAAYAILTNKADSQVEVSVGRPFVIRSVRKEWMIPLFKPLSAAESFICNEHVVLMVPNEGGWISYPPLQ